MQLVLKECTKGRRSKFCSRMEDLDRTDKKVKQKEQLHWFELLLIGVRVTKSASRNTSHSDVPDSYGLPTTLDRQSLAIEPEDAINKLIHKSIDFQRHYGPSSCREEGKRKRCIVQFIE
jgi:hypothetical protein